MTTAFLEALAAALPDLRLTVDASDLEAHRRDETAYLEPPLPLAVAFPASTAEVAGIVRLAAAHRVPLVPRGAGTCLSGGAIAVVREGDRITINPGERSISLEVSDAEIASRLSQWRAPEPKYPRGVLGKYARLVGSASRGAVTS
jgi:dihydroxy-acid dehydratase